jgi:hypothetical protein
MAAYNLNPIFDNVMKQKRLQNNIFSFYLNQREGGSDSKLTVGGLDPSLIAGPIHYHKVIDPYYWTLQADNILLDGKDVGFCPGGCRVIADTGTSLMTGPSSDLSSLFSDFAVLIRRQGQRRLELHWNRQFAHHHLRDRGRPLPFEAQRVRHDDHQRGHHQAFVYRGRRGIFSGLIERAQRNTEITLALLLSWLWTFLRHRALDGSSETSS